MPYSQQQITSRHRWSNNVFSFTTTRPQGFDFKNGEFITLGLRPQNRLISRAYSIVSTNRDDYLEFLSIEVEDGPLTSRLSQVDAGSYIWLNSKSTGSLTLDHIRPGRNLYMLATGTGVAPFISLLRAGEVFQQFDKVILVHTVRYREGLAYREEMEAKSNGQFLYLPTVTREDFANTERGAALFRDDELSKKLGIESISAQDDSVMLCGNPEMNREMTQYLEQTGWTMTSYRGVGNFTVEQAFVLPRH